MRIAFSQFFLCRFCPSTTPLSADKYRFIRAILASSSFRSDVAHVSARTACGHHIGARIRPRMVKKVEYVEKIRDSDRMISSQRTSTETLPPYFLAQISEP